MPQVKFAVITSSRTGSTWLIDLLNLQPGVSAHGELFLGQPRLSPALAGRNDVPRFIETAAADQGMRVRKVFRYLDALYMSNAKTGFKLMYTQLRSYPEILAYFALRSVRIVHLLRANALDAVVSEELARLTGASHVRADEVRDVPQVVIDTTTLVDRLSSRRNASRKARVLVCLSRCPAIEVTYEKLVAQCGEFARVCEFLGVSHVEGVASHLQKRGTGRHRDAIANYEEVRSVLRSSRFADMLN